MAKKKTNTWVRLCEWCFERPIVEGNAKDQLAWVECRECGSSGPARETKVAACEAWNQAMRWIAEGKARDEPREDAA